MLLRKFHDIESKAFSKSINKNKDEDKVCSLKDIVEGLKGASIRKLTEEEKDLGKF